MHTNEAVTLTIAFVLVEEHSPREEQEPWLRVVLRAVMALLS